MSVTSGNNVTNICRVTPLSKKVQNAITKSRRSQGDIAREAQVTRSWVASVSTGRTAKPAPDKLARLAGVLGLDARELLALSDQLGAPLPDVPDSDLASAIREQAAAIDRLAEVIARRDRERDEWLRGLISGLAEQARARTDDPTNTLHEVSDRRPGQ